jgi:hypothetical protein
MMNNVLRFSLFTSTAEDKTTAETCNQKDTDNYLRRQSPILVKSTCATFIKTTPMRRSKLKFANLKISAALNDKAFNPENCCSNIKTTPIRTGLNTHG